MFLEIDINEACIAEGKKFSIWASPMALAVRNTNAFRDDKNSFLMCGREVIIGFLKDTDTKLRINLPDVARRWITDFDTGKRVKPLLLRVEI